MDETYRFIIHFSGWSEAKGIQANIEDMSFEELDINLRKFYAEARSQNGDHYSRATLLSLRNGIERYLNSPPHNIPIKIGKDPRFVLSNKVLDAQIKQLKRDGKENTAHKPPLADEDLQKLKTSQVLSPSNPHSLLKNVWFHVSLYWCRRGREGQQKLSSRSFTFEKDANQREYVTMAHDECTKNHPGGLADVPSYEKMGRMYKTESQNDGYSCLKLYLSKLNPKCEALFQYPKRSWRSSDNIWFENRPIGLNKLGQMMATISKEAKLSRVYTNHSVRSTAITVWSKAGLPDRQIMAISGHRSESSLKSYHSRPSTGQLERCSDVLSSAMGENIKPKVSQPMYALSSIRKTDEKSSEESSSGASAMPQKLFDGCTINGLTIHFNR